MMTAGKRATTKRYSRRRDEIINVASRHINAFGVRGMTLTAIARDLRIDTSSLLYYFKNKDELAVACLGRTLEWQNDAARSAVDQTSIEAVVRSFLHRYLNLHLRSAAAEPRMAILSDMHSLTGEGRRVLFSAYGETVSTFLARFDRAKVDRSHALVAIAVILATAHWLSAWIQSYSDSDFPRVETRLIDLLMQGMGTGTAWPAPAVSDPDRGGSDAQSRFLHAATALLNRDGYHGASVEKIAAELGVSTGSFYHHLDNKDDLVVACFERSHQVQVEALAAAEGDGDDKGRQIAGALATLVDLQLRGDSPLLRSGTYQALPQDLRAAMLALAQRDTLHVAGLVADGVAQGTIRAVDPMIAAHVFMTIVTAAGDLRRWDGHELATNAGADLGVVLEHGIGSLVASH